MSFLGKLSFGRSFDLVSHENENTGACTLQRVLPTSLVDQDI